MGQTHVLEGGREFLPDISLTPGLLPAGIHGGRGTAEGSATSMLELAKYLDQRWVRGSLSPTVTL